MSSLSGVQLDRLREALRVPPVVLGRYEILSELGRGGMGVVYLARDTQLQRDVALKVIDPGVESAELESRLEHEARLIGRLAHPGIVPIHDLGRHDGVTLFYVMKHVDGQTLEQWLPAQRSRAERLRMFQKLCDPVSFAHAQGVAHRDLKPANVMIGAFGEVLVMDWGLAREFDSPAGQDEGGTPGYREPRGREGTRAAEPRRHDGAKAPMEVATVAVSDSAGEEHRLAAQSLIAGDVFSLGAILFFLLTGQHPTAIAPLDPRALDRAIDSRLNAICARATHEHGAARYASVRQLEDDILRYLDGEAVHAYRERWYESVGRWVRRHQLVLSLILMYLLMRVIVALIR